MIWARENKIKQNITKTNRTKRHFVSEGNATLESKGGRRTGKVTNETLKMGDIGGGRAVLNVRVLENEMRCETSQR